MKVLLVGEHAELQRLKSQEAQLMSTVVESELVLKRHKGNKSAKKGNSGKYTDLEAELQRHNEELDELHKRIAVLETQVCLYNRSLTALSFFT